MGMITIEVAGSFKPNKRLTFSAIKYGHASAVANAIQFLSEEVLPRAIENDHRCHATGCEPEVSWGNLKEKQNVNSGD